MFSSCFKKYCCDFCQTNYLSIYRTHLHEICRIRRSLAADKRCYFFDLSRDVALWQPILLAKSTAFPHLVVGMTFARAVPPAKGDVPQRRVINRTAC